MGSHGVDIKPLGQESISRIVAEQAVTDLASVVKELVDNSLDADSTLIKIRLFGHGLSVVEVSDDGTGIPPASRPFVATRYATSKITHFDDIYSGTGLTMGFRGEALFSMACLSDKLVVATRTDAEEMAQKMEFKRDGTLDLASVESMHRKVGTTVAVVQPFSALPARRADLERRIRVERSKVFQLLQAYAIFNVGVQINLIDVVSSGEVTALATSASSSTLEETVSSVLGHKVLTSLTRIKIDLKDVLKRKESNDDEIVCDWEISGLVSKSPLNTEGKPAHYYCINGRVVQLPKIAALLRKIWNNYGGKKKPTSILTFSMPNDTFDINLSPDKQQVLLNYEEEICELLQETVSKLWASETEGVFQSQTLEIPQGMEQDADDGVRQMHKRRFAFVHDLAKAKMQHDLEGRQVSDGNGEEKKQTDSDNPDEPATAEASPQSATTTEAEPPTKKAKVVSREELAIASDQCDQEKSDSVPQSAPRTQRALDDRVSDLERRKWTEIQAKFRRVETDDLSSVRKSRVSPVTPDDFDSTVNANTSNAASPERRYPSRRSREAEKDSPSAAQRLSLLQQFAFRPGDKTNDSGKMRRKDEKPSISYSRSPYSQKNGTEAQRVSGRNHVKEETSPRHPPTEKIAAGAQSAGARRSLSKNQTMNESKEQTNTRTMPARPEVEKTSSASAAENSQVSNHRIANIPSTSADRPEENIPEKQQPVRWASFGNVIDVCRASRIQRIEMQERKRNLSNMRKAAQNGDYGDTDAAEVVQSVGEMSDDNPISSTINMTKSQFRDGMEVIGQFNMGFILARDERNNIWILDQHACDEKYNFERLCRETVLHEQRLLKPMPLDLTPAEEACILDHLEVFEANGFRFEFDQNAPVRHRLRLTALPHSGAHDGRKAVQFGKEDVSALCSILSDGHSYDAGQGGTGTDGTGKYGNNAVRRYAGTASSQADDSSRIVARLPKAIAMFASRACRTSIMIGTSLSPQQMDKLVKRLADVEHPWNCPHGRPTMRHVGETLRILRDDERRNVEHYAGPTASVTPMTQESDG